jgi:phospholipid/cholesterol/gamma-HCH transport system substrate-binding protein
MQAKKRLTQLGKIEKKGLGFLAFSFLILVLTAGYVAQQRGWLASKVVLKTSFKTALGLREGTSVLLSGVTVGEVSHIDVKSFEQVIVFMKVRSKYALSIYKDAIAQVIRPIAIGEKQINILPGSLEDQPVKDGQVLEGRDSRELVDMISTGESGNYLELVDNMAKLLKNLSEVMGQKEDQAQLIKTIQEVNLTLKSVQTMSADINHLTRNVLGTSDMTSMIKNMAELTPRIKGMLGAVEETLEELTITLKAMQESFLFRSGAQKAKKHRKKTRNK